MSPVSEKRTLDPEQVHQLWSAIVYLLKQLSLNADDTSCPNLATPVPINSFYSHLNSDKKESLFRKGSESIESIVQQAIKENLLILDPPTQNGLTNGTCTDSTVALPIDEKLSDVSSRATVNGISGHDWYCFECHLGGKSLFECQQCWRVYHSSCVQSAYEFAVKLETEVQTNSTNDSSSHSIRARNFTCPICTLTQKYSTYSVGSRQFSQQEFNTLLGYAFSRFKTKTSQISRSLLTLKDQAAISSLSLPAVAEPTPASGTPNFSELTTQLALKHLTFKSIDLADIEDKLNQSGYESIGEFLGECLTLRHLIEVSAVAALEVENKQNRIRDALSRMLEACRYDLKEMLGCVACYRNSNQTVVDRYWFCRPCDPPHMLVFARQKGYPYWPAKVINPRGSIDSADFDSYAEFDVRFFGANHERSLIDKSNIKHINSSLLELGINKLNPSQEKALSELRVHRDMLEKFEKGILDVMDPNMVPEDGHKIKRSYTKRTTDAEPVRGKSRTNSIDDNGARSDSSAGSNVKRKDAPRSSTRVQAKRLRTHRSNTTESESSVSKVAEKSDSEPESDLFVDAKEDLSENNNNEVVDDDDAATDVDEPTVVEAKSSNSKDAKFSSATEDEEEHPVEVKRGRGRPRKYFPADTAAAASSLSKSSPSKSKGRVRRQKVLFSPQNKTATTARQSASPLVKEKVATPARGPGRKPRSISPVAAPSESTNDDDTQVRPKRGRQSLSSTNTSSIVKSPIKQRVASPAKLSSTSRVNMKPSLSPTRVSPNKVLNKFEKSKIRRKQNIERQKQILQVRRKLKLRKEQALKAATLPRHIPPVTATKSSPAFSVTSTPALNKSIISPVQLPKTHQSFPINRPIVNPILSPHLLSPQNGFTSSTRQAQFSLGSVPNGFNCSNSIPKSPLISPVPRVQPTSQPVAAEKEQIEENSALKSLLNETNEDSVDGTEDSQPAVNGTDANDAENDTIKSNTDEQVLPKETLDETKNTETNDDDDDYDDYDDDELDDEQLEEQINDYLAYQEEKELFEKQMHFFHQQQLIQQQQYFQQLQAANRPLMPPPNGLIDPNHHMTPTKQGAVRTNGMIEPPPKKYLEYSSSCIYSPTIRNRNLVNTYLHQISNNTFGGNRNDYLAQFILRKDEPEPEEVPAAGKKRGRPPKVGSGDEVVDRSAKAKSICEKSYLQESACNRGCLMKNIKTFKKFRDFVEAQNKDENAKNKKEIEELKQELHRLKNQKTELEGELKLERELSKRCDPQLISQQEDRHRRQISDIKHKQWCTICEAEASYFCCFNTNYCSRECQMKHWFMDHSTKCTRSRNNNANGRAPGEKPAAMQKCK